MNLFSSGHVTCFSILIKINQNKPETLEQDDPIP